MPNNKRLLNFKNMITMQVLNKPNMGKNTTAPTTPASQPPIRSERESNPEVNPVRDTVSFSCLPIVSNGVNPTSFLSCRYILVARGNSRPMSKPDIKNRAIKISAEKFVYPKNLVIINADK